VLMLNVMFMTSKLLNFLKASMLGKRKYNQIEKQRQGGVKKIKIRIFRGLVYDTL
jgi:hypothetical protein